MLVAGAAVSPRFLRPASVFPPGLENQTNKSMSLREIETQQLRGIERCALPLHRPVEMRPGHASGGAAQAKAISGGNALALFHIDAREMHGEREQAQTVVDD